MATEMTCRLAEPEDAAAIAVQGSAAFRETFGHQYSEEELSGYCTTAYAVAAVEQTLRNPQYRTWLAESGADIIGHLLLTPNALPHLPGDDPDRTLEIKRLYLAGAAKGTGIANQLIDLAIGHAERCKGQAIYLSCWSENPRAVRFYQRHGFEIVGSHPFAVGPRIDIDHVMRRALDRK